MNGLTIERSEAPEVQFTVGGDIQGSSGCHDFRGPVHIGDGSVTVGTLTPGSANACPESTRAFETAFLAALQKVATFRRGRPEETLILDGAGGTIVLVDSGTP